ncbi:MAG: hypothetical protein C0592_06685 [Marinilabiliales bacterium]|nr:MAG: hypothetical protein C0592_06685 [Marinilabiliales bacterium]
MIAPMRKLLFIIIVLSTFHFPLSTAKAQCPMTNYGIVPVWPNTWSAQDKSDWWVDMSDRGMGYFHSVYNWRELQEMLDSNTFSSFVDNIEYGKNVLGFDKYLFLFQNPATFVNRMPPYVCGSPFTDETVMRDMEAFICSMIDSMHHVIDYFALGGEVDMYFKTRPEERDSFMVIATNVSDYIDQYYPTIKFGIVLTTRNGIQYDQTMWNMIKPISDMLVVTYWPLDSKFGVDSLDLDSVQRDINDLLTAAGTMPVVIKESGLPTHDSLGSSEQLQSKFIYETFIHTMNESQIEAVGYDFLADFDSAQTFAMQAYYELWTTDFYYYTISLGLMDSVGNPKPGYDMYLSMLDTLCMMAGFDQNKERILDMYPNPASFGVQLNWGMDADLLEIFDAAGQIVFSRDIKNERTLFVNLSDFENGLYIIRLSGDIVITRKLSILKD